MNVRCALMSFTPPLGLELDLKLSGPWPKEGSHECDSKFQRKGPKPCVQHGSRSLSPIRFSTLQPEGKFAKLKSGTARRHFT